MLRVNRKEHKPGTALAVILLRSSPSGIINRLDELALPLIERLIFCFTLTPKQSATVILPMVVRVNIFYCKLHEHRLLAPGAREFL